jgi:hypothetical protein
MPSEHSIQRLARLAKKVQSDLRRGGMAITFRLMFRSTATLARIVFVLAEHVAHLSHEVEVLRSRLNAQGAPSRPAGSRVRASAPMRTEEGP